RLIHPLILPFIGYASFGLHTAIVSWYMKNGNLLEYFKARGAGVDKEKMMLQVAEAVNHLHTIGGLVHGDLKCANVLVSDLGDALLSDFGLSTFVEKAHASATTATNVRQMYTLRFAAPEILLDVAGDVTRVRSKTRESDVYAFGMLMLEAMTERPPWPDLSSFAVMHRVCSGSHPRKPDTGFDPELWDVCRSCWSFEPSHRPTIQSVLDTLTVSLRSWD
ncbi:kinase-like protein, partial [Auricularia subglabra TFB-10046 SS5]